jgi:hypothetical protein
MGRVEAGQVVFSAGGGFFNVKSHADASKAMVAIANVIGGLIYGAFMYRAIRGFRENCGLDWAEVGIKSAMFAKDVFSAATLGRKPKDAGHVQLYGDAEVSVAAPMKISLRSGVTADLSAGLSASVQAVALAGVTSAFIANLRGTYLAAVDATQVRLRGRTLTTIAARKGTVWLEGNRIRVGRRRLRSQGEKPIARNKSFMDVQMEPTTNLYVEAENHLSVAVGLPAAPNGRVSVLPSAVVASAAGATVAVEKAGDASRASMSSGCAALRAGIAKGSSLRLHRGRRGRHARPLGRRIAEDPRP